MKVIDLLNKIANGEEVPKKIKFMDNEFIWRQDLARYVLVGCEDGIIAGHTLTDMRNIFACLHEKVEMLEEEKKIPEKIKDKYTSQISKVEIAQKLNEIIDYLKSKGE